jgi:hypothetical protein
MASAQSRMASAQSTRVEIQKAAQKTFKEFRAPLAQLDSAPAF